LFSVCNLSLPPQKEHSERWRLGIRFFPTALTAAATIIPCTLWIPLLDCMNHYQQHLDYLESSRSITCRCFCTLDDIGVLRLGHNPSDDIFQTRWLRCNVSIMTLESIPWACGRTRRREDVLVEHFGALNLASQPFGDVRRGACLGIRSASSTLPPTVRKRDL